MSQRAFVVYCLLAKFAFAVNLRPASPHEVDPMHVYIHVPKCAGTSFSMAMQGVSHTSRWWPTDHHAAGCTEHTGKFGDMIFTLHCGLSELESCIHSGKACYDDNMEFMPDGLKTCPRTVPASAPLRFVMLVRDPVQRVLSEYYFFKDMIQESHMGSRFAKDLAPRLWTSTVRDIAMTGSIMAWVRAAGNKAHNAVTKAILDGKAGHQAPMLRQAPRQIAGHISSCAVFDEEDYTSHWQEYYHSKNGTDVEALINSDQGLLSAAIKTIETRFDFVGLVEHFDESVQRLSALLGLASPPKRAQPKSSKAAHASDKPQEGQIDSNVIQEIRKRNALDVGVYSAVMQGKFWRDSTVASTKLAAGENESAPLTWQAILDGDREDKVFDAQVLLPSAAKL